MNLGLVSQLCEEKNKKAFSFLFWLNMFRIVFNVGKEDVLGMHEKPVRCVEYSYAAGIVIVLIIIIMLALKQ